MHYLVKYLDRLYRLKEERGFRVLYFMIDIHNTVLVPSYSRDESYTYFPYAKDVLQLLSKQENVRLIMWTSSHKEMISKYLEHFTSEGINFNYVNSNPEICNDSLRCLDTKFYYDVGIDDKFGFNALEDWKCIFDFLNEKYNK